MSEEKKLDAQSRAKLIRKGNEFFNEGKLEPAAKIFWLTEYKDGLIRVGEKLCTQKRPFQAMLYFQKAGAVDRLNELFGRMLWALGQWVNQ